MLFLSFLLFIWIVAGMIIFYLGGWSRRSSSTIVRGVDRRLCHVGERIRVTLECSSADLPQPEPLSETPSWDIALVIDHSGSMGVGVGSALDEACKAAINMVLTTPDDFQFSIVEFDHEAREVSPLTARRQESKRAIKGITKGGATDIALALQVANNSLNHSAIDKNTRQCAVILLSDGGSAPQPAIEAAEKLKLDKNLLLITVGTGAADMTLLRAIASTPDHCYQADQIDELTALYSEIGRMISAEEVNEVKVTEQFDSNGIWGVRAWGELQPSEHSLVDGHISWLIAALNEKPVRLTYELEAVCPGWRRISPGKAVLYAKYTEGDEQDAVSNKGPWVLVMPYIPGWQLLWLFMNPLFFIIFGKRFCRMGGITAPPEIIAPHPGALKLPPLLPAYSAEQPLNPRPTLVVGLGYSGIHSLVHCKRMAWERGKRLDLSLLHFIAIDTADEIYFPSPVAGSVGLDSEERLTLDRPLEAVIAAESVKAKQDYDWLPSAELAAGAVRPDLHRGTGHLRVLGRLAMFENRDLLRERLRPLLEHLIGQADARGIDIVLTASSGGGTGSGAVLDLAWLLRLLLDELKYGGSSITLFLSAPFSDRSLRVADEEQTMRAANHRALLAELDRFSVLRGVPLAPEKGLEAKRRWIDRVFFVGPSGREQWNALDMLYPKTGEAIFNWLASDDAQGMRAHFVTLDKDNADYTRKLGRCLLHRINPVSLYLYPRTVQMHTVIDSLRRILAQHFWGIDSPGQAVGYSADTLEPQVSLLLLQEWLDSRRQGTDFPWVFNSTAILEDGNSLQQALIRGAGPGISHGISSLARGKFLGEQRLLVRAVLDVWIMDTLNTGWSGVCEPHALAACIHALRELLRQMHAGYDTARYLAEQTTAPLVREEAGLVGEITSQAAADIEVLVHRLTGWDNILGDGEEDEEGGVLRYLDQRIALLRSEIGQLQRESVEGGSARSPILPLDSDQIGGLVAEFTADHGDELSQRIGWSLHRDGQQFDIHLHIQGSKHSDWILDTLASGKSLAEELVRVGVDIAASSEIMSLSDYDPETLPELTVESPRSDQLNPGARGIYLVQGSVNIFNNTHVEQIEISSFDIQESRIISCEEHLSSKELLYEHQGSDHPPFVFAEEYHAYRAYDLYCRQQQIVSEALKPSLVGLCREPAALLSFALKGLAERKIEVVQGDLREIWITHDPDVGEMSLAAAVADPLDCFLRVANGWMEAREVSLRQFSAADITDPAALVEVMNRHPLAAAISETPWYSQFTGVIWGLLQLRY